MTDARLLNHVAKIEAHPGWADPYYVFRGACMALVGTGTERMQLIDQQLNVRAWESAAMNAIPTGCALAGLRLERDGYVAVVTDGAESYEGSHVRAQPGLAILEAALFAASGRTKRTKPEESHA